eukprot:SM000025S08400  [mRNA]  locus=s25:512978:515587:- [translate_table: standard]
MAGLAAAPAAAAAAERRLPSLAVAGSPYQMGLAIGRAFAELIAGRLAGDRNLRTALLPFAASPRGAELVEALSETNKSLFPRYWSELQGVAAGSDQPFLEILLINLRKELAPFLPDAQAREAGSQADQCSDTVWSQAFTLNAVPPCPSEVVAGGVARNFVSRDLLEAADYQDAIRRVVLPNLAVGHNYNIMDIGNRHIVTVETTSRDRHSLLEIGETPYFHANMYRRLLVKQRQQPSSLHRQRRAEELPPGCNEVSISAILGDTADKEFPMYMGGIVFETAGPRVFTLHTAIFDLDSMQLKILIGNPKLQDVLSVLSLFSNRQAFE